MDINLDTYKTFVDIFKGYLDTALTANIWFFGLTGAILANYLSHRDERPYLKFSLIVPFIFGVALSWLSYRGIAQASDLEGKVLEIASELKITGAPPVDILRGFLQVTFVASCLVCICLLGLFFWRPRFILDRGKRSNAVTRKVFFIAGKPNKSFHRTRRLHAPHHSSLR
jgi:hypothetical protein